MGPATQNTEPIIYTTDPEWLGTPGPVGFLSPKAPTVPPSQDDTRWLADSPLADFLQFSERSDPFFVVPRAFVKIMVPWGALGGPGGPGRLPKGDFSVSLGFQIGKQVI